jgi:tetratricopeptide (TPR) repeat protein
VSFIPVLNLIPINRVAADRFAYLGVPLFCLVVGWGLNLLMEYIRKSYPEKARLAPLVFVAIAILFASITMRQNTYWKDNVALWSHCVDRSPGNRYAHYNLGKELEKLGHLDEAEVHYLVVLEKEPDNVKVLVNLSHCYIGQRKFDAALRTIKRALELDPENAFAYNNLGTYWFLKGDYNQAIQYYKKAFEIDSTDAQSLFNIGFCLEKQGRKDEAISYYKKSLEINPTYKKPRERLEELNKRSKK